MCECVNVYVCRCVCVYRTVWACVCVFIYVCQCVCKYVCVIPDIKNRLNIQIFKGFFFGGRI